MSGFIEPRPDLIVPNPGGAEDPLGESVLDPASPWMRVFEPRDVRVVIGRHQDPEREVLCARARADGVPIHRRVAGGGAVVLAPGMVVVALRLVKDHVGTSSYLERVNSALIPAVEAASGIRPLSRGLGDLALPSAVPASVDVSVDASADGVGGAAGSAGVPRKILGASMRQTGKLVIYLGVLLVDDASRLMDRYLASPSREPDYRAGRGHGAFCAHLGAVGVCVPALVSAVERSCRSLLSAYA